MKVYLVQSTWVGDKGQECMDIAAFTTLSDAKDWFEEETENKDTKVCIEEVEVSFTS